MKDQQDKHHERHEGEGWLNERKRERLLPVRRHSEDKEGPAGWRHILRQPVRDQAALRNHIGKLGHERPHYGRVREALPDRRIPGIRKDQAPDNGDHTERLRDRRQHSVLRPQRRAAVENRWHPGSARLQDRGRRLQGPDAQHEMEPLGIRVQADEQRRSRLRGPRVHAPLRDRISDLSCPSANRTGRPQARS